MKRTKTTAKSLRNATAMWCMLLPLLLLSAISPGGEHDLVYVPGELPAEFTSAEPNQHTIVFTGDIMTWDRTAELIRREGPDYPFDAAEPIIREADVAVGNLEGPVAVRAAEMPGEYRYRIPPFTLTGLREAGFDLLSLANNHVMDCGNEGFAETMSFLQDAHLRSFGAGMNTGSAARPAVLHVGRSRVAFVAAVCAETYFDDWEDAQDKGEYEHMLQLMRRRLGAGRDRSGVIVATPEVVAELVRRAAKDSDLVVACLHFGIRYHRPPTDRQRALAHAAVEAGADLVVGHHAHIWQPVECYRGVPIFYGLGNFAFGSANRRADEGLLIRATVAGGRFSGIELFPVYTKNRDPDVNYQTKILEGDAAEDVVRRLAQLSANLGAKIVYDGGRGRLDLPSGAKPDVDNVAEDRR